VPLYDAIKKSLEEMKQVREAYHASRFGKKK